MLFKLKKNKKAPVHHVEAERKVSVYDKTTARLGQGLVKLSTGNLEQAQPHFFETVHTFFADFIPIHYQFTYEDLKKEIENKHITQDIKEKIHLFIEEASKSEYQQERLTQEQLEKLFLQFSQVVELLKNELVDLPAQKNLSEKRSTNPITKVMGAILDHQKNLAEEKVLKLLKEGNTAIANKDVQKGREIYAQIGKEFEHISSEKKKDMYAHILDYYKNLIELH